MGKFENGKYVCIIKWCFRRTECGRDGVERQEGRYTNHEGAREKERWNHWMCGGEHGTSAGGISQTNHHRRELNEQRLRYEMSHRSTPKPGKERKTERGREQEGKKENRKIIIYIYILFSFMYARNCKNGESYCRSLAFLCLFLVLCTVESTHTHTHLHPLPHASVRIPNTARCVCFYEK